MHSLRAARHVRMELGDPGHEKLAPSVDRRRARGCRSPTADVRDPSVLDNDRLIGEDGLTIHWDYRDAGEDHRWLLRDRQGGDTDGEKDDTGGERRTKHRGLHERIERRHTSYARPGRTVLTHPSRRSTRGYH